MMTAPRTRSHRWAGPLAVLLVVAGLSSAGADETVDTTPPGISIKPATSLTGRASVEFDEPVRLVSSENVVLRPAGGTPIAAVLRCYGADGASVACDIGDVRRVTLDPSGAFVTGQLYEVLVNPESATVEVADAAGNAAPTTTKTFRASVAEQETSVGARFKWDYVTQSKAFDGSYRRERQRGARVTASFTGTSVTWYTARGPRQGKASVYVDGNLVRVVNNYASSASYRVPIRVSGLSGGNHRLAIVVRGERGSRAARDHFVSVDRISASNLSAVKYSWDGVSASQASGDRYARSSVGGARVSFRFRARGIDWYTITSPRMGKADVYIDGVRKQTVDNYSSTTRYGVRRSITGLSDATHTITIRVRGEKRAASSGTRVVIDRWVVRVPSRTAFKRLGAWIDLYDYSVDPEQGAAAMRARGVKTIYLQTARYNSDRSIVYPDKVGAWLEAAHAEGMKVVGWYLPAYDQFLDRDVARTIAIEQFRSARGHRFDALAIDIEYKGATESLAEFNDGIRLHLARVRAAVGVAYPIGAIVPAPLGMAISPSSWEGFPWSAIGRDADVVLPMSYWSYRTDCASKPQHCPYEYTKTNIAKARRYTALPVHIIGGIGNDVSTSEVEDFARGARDGNAYGGSLYDYRTTASSFWSHLATLNSL